MQTPDPTAKPSPPRRIAPLLVLIVVIAAATVAFLQFSGRYPKRFAAVVDGQIYRSGEVRPEHLARLKEEIGLRTVLSLLNPEADESKAEMAAAEELGIVYLNVPLRGNGASTPADRVEIKKILFDPSHQPILVHCSAGTNRTGLAVGMYRLHQQAWTREQVHEEMLRFDFENEAHHENLRQALDEEGAAVGRGTGNGEQGPGGEPSP